MPNHINQTARLNALILETELLKRTQEEELKEEIKMKLESLRPSQLIKKAFNEFVREPDFKKNALSASLGLVAGFVSRKVVVRKNSGFLRKILGTLIQIGVSKIVGKKMTAISHAAENKGLSDPGKNDEGPEVYADYIRY